MKLYQLIKGLPQITVIGPKEVNITAMTSNSQAVFPGALFIAKPGLKTHGAQYIPQAIEGGAVALLTDFFDPTLKGQGITQLIHSNVASLEGELASRFFGRPSEKMTMVGVTGTNGKTTTAYLVKALLDHVRGPCGMIGTIEYSLGKKKIPAVRTTPDAITNQLLLAEMVKEGCQSAVMEVSSHALEQRRVDAITYDIAIYTHLTQDHLDYHKTMEAYAAAKGRLFSHYSKQAVINVDCPWHKQMIAAAAGSVLTYGITEDADLKATNVSLFPDRTEASIQYKGEEIACRWPLIGRYNVYNVLAAMSVPLLLGTPLKALSERLCHLPQIPGRLEKVLGKKGVRVFVDFAHSEDALKNVLVCLRELTPGRLITVFGCGGDRDQLKRPQMGRVAEELSDLVVVTSDNPRSEDPLKIIEEILSGVVDHTTCYVEPDRRGAIQYALTQANPNDIVLIAGKGHEPFQEFAHKTVEFDDRVVAFELCMTK